MAAAAGPPLDFHLNIWSLKYIKGMTEQSTQTNNHERTKKKVGRPKCTCAFTDEEKRARMIPRLYYSLNIEKERERKRL